MDYKSYSTYEEILRQPDTLKGILKEIAGRKVYDLEVFKKAYDEILLFGCGSSYNLSQSAAFFTRSIQDSVECVAVPSSELLINTASFIKSQKKYLVVGFSRSGDTTESVEVLRKLKDYNNVDLFTFTCREGSSFCKITENNFVCRNAAEESIVMTVSFSSMLFAYFTIFASLTGNNVITSDLKRLIDAMDQNIFSISDFTGDYIKKVDFNSYFVLGSGFNYGLAVEADLKMKEMSQIPSYSYHIYEFSHGPKSLLKEDSLCLILTPGKSLFKLENILQEYLHLGTSMLVIGNKTDSFAAKGKLKFFLETEGIKNELVESFINIPVFQMLAFFKTLKNNLNPDLPKNLSYTVKI
jgi:glucosamine--fructose-6-phosphate aminotransferase (isomerizing)